MTTSTAPAEAASNEPPKAARAIETEVLPERTVVSAIQWIAEDLRPADRAELSAAGFDDPLPVLLESWRTATACWLLLDRTSLPIAVFGVSPHPSRDGAGLAWMVGTPEIDREVVPVARNGRQFVKAFHDYYQTVYAWPAADNELSLRWLEWTGFERSGVEAEIDETPFIEFVRTA
jgi:hypothetical protein